MPTAKVKLTAKYSNIDIDWKSVYSLSCLLYTSDAADEEDSVDLGGRRIIKKKILGRL